jgi:hypothetical protein
MRGKDMAPITLQAMLAAAGFLSAPALQAQTAPAPRPAASAPGAADCAARWAAYQRSQACYAPFLNANGSLKPGAQQACGKPVLDPSPQCGPAPAR